jgi:hypothetical protein
VKLSFLKQLQKYTKNKNPNSSVSEEAMNQFFLQKNHAMNCFFFYVLSSRVVNSKSIATQITKPSCTFTSLPLGFRV